MENATREVLACDLENATVASAVESWVKIVRDAVGVVCLQDDTSDEYCYPAWVAFATDVNAPGTKDNFTALATLPPVHCKPCLYKFFKHLLEFAEERPDETAAQFEERMSAAVHLRLFCSKSLVDEDAFCLTELESFRATVNASAALIASEDLDDKQRGINGTFDSLCSESGCIQRYLLAAEYFGDGGEGVGDASKSFAAIRSACVRDEHENLCANVGFAAFTGEFCDARVR